MNTKETYKYWTQVEIGGVPVSRLWTLRRNTQDEFIVKEVYEQNCYKLPDSLIGKVIIDIGANIGAFAAACADRGSSAVYCYDPCLEISTKLFPLPVSLHTRAVVGDKGPERVSLLEGGFNGDTHLTGGVNTFGVGDNGKSARAVRISDVVNTVLDRFGSDSEPKQIWLKLDCEGREYDILSSDLPWDKIERIFGECHTLIDGKLSKNTPSIESEEFPIEPNHNAIFDRLSSVGYGTIKMDANPDDEHLHLFWAEDWMTPEDRLKRALEDGKIREFQSEVLKMVEESHGKVEGYKSVVVLTPFRNARKYLPLYFKQLFGLRDLLRDNGYSLRLVAAEGDSLDGTRERIVDLARESNIPLTLVDTTHGGMKWGSVEDPVRMRVMSEVMNKALDEVQEWDHIAVWIMSDLEWEPQNILNLIDWTEEEQRIFAPMVFVADTNPRMFYDTWAFRDVGGKRFSPFPPYYSYYSASEGCQFIDSAGSCLIIPAHIARMCRAFKEEAVSFCRNAKTEGFEIVIDTGTVIYHAPRQKGTILWISDAVCISGFSRVAHAMFPILSEAGYDLEIVAINYWGNPHNFPYTIWPASMEGQDPSGTYRLQSLLWHNRGKYDAIICLDDPWNVPRITAAIDQIKRKDEEFIAPPVIAWVTVDGENIKGEDLNGSHVVTCTGFGSATVLIGDFDGSAGVPAVVPFGVDTSVFHPFDKQESRSLAASEVPEDAFIVGVVANNQLRKNIYLTLECFSIWRDRTFTPRERKEGSDNAYLYLCLGPDNNSGCDIQSLVRYFDLQGRVIINSHLLSDPLLARVYNSFDVYLSLSLGEGFGLTALEAMACGIPCVVTAWSGYGSWIKDGTAIKVPCSHTQLTAPLNAPAYVIGGVADKERAVEALTRLYSMPDLREKLSERGIKLAQQMTWKETGDRLIKVIENVINSFERQEEREAIIEESEKIHPQTESANG